MPWKGMCVTDTSFIKPGKSGWLRGELPMLTGGGVYCKPGTLLRLFEGLLPLFRMLIYQGPQRSTAAS